MPFLPSSLGARIIRMITNKSIYKSIALGVLLLDAMGNIFGAELKTLPGHVPPQSKLLAAKSDLVATNELRLVLGVPLRDAAGLEKFLQTITDPRSPEFRHYLTPTEFTARFGPTESDYTAVKNFAKVNGLKITGEHDNRLVLDVSGKVENIQRAFQIKLQRFQHPTEAREFFAPDQDPTVAAALPLADVSGLSNFKMPHPKLVKPKIGSARVVHKSGSAPNGDYLGYDFRKAYVPDTTLTGAGQIVGLLQFDGFYQSDITAYQDAAGLPHIPVESVLIDGFNGIPTTGPNAGNGEVALDIELSMAMAPGLSKVICFSADPSGFQNDILSAMVSSNMVKQFSCSWGWSGGPNITTDNLFKQMAAQGQSFFNASGDSGAFTLPVNSTNAVDNPNEQNAPSSSPYITHVGGTFLNTDNNGVWTSETVWNGGNNFSGPTGSSGGISTYYPIPSWQTGFSMTKNKGSSTQRNIPDVAMVADYIYYYHDNGQADEVAGTSCSAPLWAGFTALINEQAAALGKPSVGLINAAIYAIGKGADYASTFHDVTVGNNTTAWSPTAYFATTNYDLCTGLGTPAGQTLIDELVGAAETLQISPAEGFVVSGVKHGGINPSSSTILIQNNGNFPVTWALQNSNAVNWLKVRPFKGTLAPGDSAQLTVAYTFYTTNLPAGNYTAYLKFTNLMAHSLRTVPFTMQMFPELSVSPAQGFTANGAVGGPFDISTQDFTFTNRSPVSRGWRAIRLANWIDILPSNNGVVAGDFGTANFTVSLNANSIRLPVGEYATSVYVLNQLNQLIQVIPFTVRVGQNIVSNGGFETGDFRGWTLAAADTFVTNSSGFIHSGNRSAMLGQQISPGYLSQILPTTAGQTYQLSLWLANPKSTRSPTPNEFSVLWEGNPIFDQSNLPFTNWMNLRFNVTATANGSSLQLGFRCDPFWIGLDDVTVKPVPPPFLSAIAQKLVAPAGTNVSAVNAGAAVFNFTFAVTAGYNYQIQWKTNLLQPDWSDYGDPIKATNEILNYSDTKTVAFPQKFFRLKLVP